MAAVAVQCEGSRSEGWSCLVTLREGGLDISKHYVRVWWSDLQRLAPYASEPSALAKARFRLDFPDDKKTNRCTTDATH